MSKKIRLDKAEIFSLKYIIILGLVASILALASWIVTAINMNLTLLRLNDAATYYNSLNQVSAAALLFSAQLNRFIVGMILSGIMLLTTIFFFRNNSLILFDYTITKTHLGIILILASLFNMIFGAHGFWVGGILGILAGVWAIINDIYVEDWKFHRQMIV